MILQTTISSALAAITTETSKAFDWLVGGIDRSAPVTFVPNPGNIGDAAINVACFDYLTQRFDKVEVCAISDTPRTECVFVGGGGNLVEPLYADGRDFLDRLALDHRLFLFPATIQGCAESLQRVAPIARILCRESISFSHVAKQIGSENALLAHDAAFLLAPRLRSDFAIRIGKAKTARLRSFRTDKESVYPGFGTNDIMREHGGNWTDLTAARNAVWSVASHLLDFAIVETDRLHCAILAAILGRQTVLRENSYYKNAAVFDRSLSRLSNTAILPAGVHVMDGLRNAGRRMVRGVRRRSHWVGRARNWKQRV